MSKTYQEFTDARAVRLETLSLVEGLDQEQADFRPAEDKWSVGEVLDHLLKLDALVIRELEVTLDQRRSGIPFVYRSLGDVDTTLPWVLRPILPFFEIPFSVFNAVFPQSLRRALTGNRSIPLQAPGIIKPRSGRPIEPLREELRSSYDVLEQQQDDNAEYNLSNIYYYNPITGLNSVAGMYRFIANHEERHQGQLRDLLGDASFPEVAKAA